MRSPYVSILILVTGFMMMPVALAENGSSGDFEQEELETFLQARADVLSIQEEYSNRLQSAQDDQAVAQLQAEAREKMAAAVQDAGLSIDEFNQIAQAAQSDPDVAAELESLAE
ncbi:DUF4168 domain-containing protein [Halofilum ochraceum]|uniref:DUF4168 domain-containing protein n=1 Tax=Halofilum ochraceum TaxID=1611323 RepID=UPI0008D95B41|nr:DUF4168 domain-containing protein [Halofilum ochraceum]